ncbi:MAG: sugar-binding domain-containing protein, partial [Chitinophagaceae bacterium]
MTLKKKFSGVEIDEQEIVAGISRKDAKEDAETQRFDDPLRPCESLRLYVKRPLSIASLIFLLGFTLKSQQTERLYLSGTGSDQTINWEFFCTAGMNSGKWSTIAVPSCWELQGFGKYDYGFARDSVRGKEKGLYKYSFRVPASWKNKKINIVFEGSMTDTEVKINGQLAGEKHQG